MKQVKLFLAALLFFTVSALNAQNIKITGVVSDATNGEAIPFASITLKGTTTGVSADENGNFAITAPTSGTLIFSSIGFNNQEITINGKLVINAALSPDAVALDNVVVVAYGTAKKESLTGAVSAVNSKSIEKRAVSNVASVLEGQASGVQVNNSYGEPGKDPDIRIRGFTSVNGSNTPLYVVDGVPYGGNMSDLNAQDIESISVLKDAASAALYGNRAANGVILITTKKGKSDKINLRASITQGVYNRGIAEYERIGADDWMEVMWKGYRNSLLLDSKKYPTKEAANAQASKALVDTYLKYNIYNKPNDQLFDANGKLTAQMLGGYSDDLDWYEDIERLGWRQDYVISADAATEKTSYFFSAGYLNEKGYVTTSDFQRFTGRANVTITPKKWLRAGLNISASHQISNNTSGSAGDASSYTNPFMFARQIAPIYPVHLHDMATGDYVLDAFGNKQYDGGTENERPQYLNRHVTWENELNMDKTYRNTVNGQAFMDIKFLKDFTFSIKGDINLNNQENQTYDNATIGNGNGNAGRAKRIIQRLKNYNFQQQLMWKKEFGKHNVDVLLGHENYSWNRSYLYGYKTTEILEGGTDMINFTNITSLYDYVDSYKTESYLARARYNYDNKYFFDASFRRDGSSRFHPDNRWGNFWSAGGSWIITRENFMENTKGWLDMLKLRASYGEVGNDAGAGYYGYMNLVEIDQNANLGALYLKQNEAYNIKWETTTSFGIALETRLFDRLNLSVEYFDKRSKDLLFDVYLPLSSGATSTTNAEATLTQNLGTVSNSGVEINFDIDAIRTKNWKWNIGFNATALNNKIKKLPEANRKEGIINGTKKYMEGHGIYDFWLYQYVGVDQMTGQSLYLIDTDKYYTGSDKEVGKSPVPSEYVQTVNGTAYTTYTTYSKKDWSGSVIPKIYGSINTSLSWKNLDLSVLCTYALGGKTLDYSYKSLMGVSKTPSANHKDILKSWDGAPEGMTETSTNRIDPNGVPQINFTNDTYNNATSSRFLQNGSYFVIKNVTLSYRLPAKICNKIDLSNVAFNFGIDNLATFTKLKGMNPQQSFSGTNDNAFVSARVFSLGININL